MVLLIDNYDSFTWNLAHRLGELGGDVRVVRNDRVTVDEIAALRPARLVISPGPGRPESAGVSVKALQYFADRLPILGVCLGHQAMSVAFGGQVDRAAGPMHGKTSMIAHEGTHLFAGLEGPMEVGRYHSLVIPPDAVPEGFVRAAWVVGDGTIMGIRHRERPLFGVQFHPESVLTPSGQRVLQNFLEIR